MSLFSRKKRTRFLWLVVVAVVVLLFCVRLGNKAEPNPDLVVPYEGTVFDPKFPEEAGGPWNLWYRNGKGLAYIGSGGIRTVCPDLEYHRQCSWDGEAWVYYDPAKEAIYAFSGEESQLLLDWPEEEYGEVSSLYRVGDYLILCDNYNNVYRYHLTSGEISSLNCEALDYEWTFIYKDWLLCLWGKNVSAASQAVAIHVPTGEIVGLALQRTTTVGAESLTKASYTSDGEYLYLSLYSWYPPDWSEESISAEGTYAIRLGTWEVQKLGDTHFQYLLCTDSGLYGWGLVPIGLPEKN